MATSDSKAPTDMVERVDGFDTRVAALESASSAQGTALDNHDKTIHELETRLGTVEALDRDTGDQGAKISALQNTVEEQGHTITALEAQLQEAVASLDAAASSGGSADTTSTVLRDFLSTYFRNEKGSDSSPDAKPLWERI